MSIPSSSHPPHYHFRVGIGYILLSWIFFTLMGPIVRDVNKHMPMVAILCVQGIAGVLCTLPWIVKHGKDSLKTPSWGLILLRTGCGLLIYTFLFLSIVHTSLVDAFLLNNASPLFLPIVIWIWMKLPIEHKLWPGLIGGFIGLLLILKPGAELLNLGALYGVAMAIFAAIAMVSLRLLSFTTRSHTVLFYYFLLSALITLPIAIYIGKVPTGADWIELIGIAALSTLGQTCMTRAFHHASPTALGPFNYSSVIYAGILDWILYGAKPDLFSFLGILLIVFGGIWSIKFSTPFKSQEPQ